MAEFVKREKWSGSLPKAQTLAVMALAVFVSTNG
jgi:hypothetical protein